MTEELKIVQPEEYNHIWRILNQNIIGNETVWKSLTVIRGIGRRYSRWCCLKAGINPDIRAGELTQDNVDKVVDVIKNPKGYNVPLWFLNRQRDKTTGENNQLVSNDLQAKLRMDLENYKKIRCNRGLRHYWGLRVRGQHTRTTGRWGRTVGVSRKKA
ncbi:hypothetical protein A3Q56_00586 [Intoshia linei]|uniref:Small ribosomal subunit protein uS13 n=1 Tax=Intoshia linei TaxID=1819745 RepID=A0A177BD96_9BILA|nr:hypothetical protein A3Q56_00586 [Intoshia linei]